MYYSELTEIYERLEKTSSRLEMTSIISDFLTTVPEENLSIVLLFLIGGVFPPWSEKELGIGNKLVIKAISTVSGSYESSIEDEIRKTGDTGSAAANLLVKKTQRTLFMERLTVEKVHKNLNKLAGLTGTGSQDKKIAYIAELLSFAEPNEARYITRTILEELRLGVGAGIIRDAIAKTFDVEAGLVERGYSLISDFGEVARIAKSNGNEGLKNLSVTLGRPMRVMLAIKVKDVAEAIDDLGKAAFEIKYDGMRTQIHKNNDEIKLFTRRLENITKQFPEIVKMAKECIMVESAIIEGEMVAIRSLEDKRPRPFQDLSRRIKRKYDILEMVEKIPVEINLFDLVYLNGKSEIDEKFVNRRRSLEKIVHETDRFRIAKQMITEDVKEATQFYKYALSLGHEGIMVKNLDAPYKPGSRVGYMYKIKPVMETFDLAIVGATWGEGRRAHWLASFLLATVNPNTGEFLTIGRMGTGFTDEEFKEMTKLLNSIITEEIGKEVKLKPKIVVEVAYEEIQRSPTYTSGYALRFPRLVRMRADKGVEDIDTLERIESLLRT